ncbi:MAG TPA: 2-hydroxyacyl-CoA dehydratase [Firmicutes bacterium]|nr:2-hydroxyacyl-CoA dehydratase [Bacillota bacterium]
MLAANLIQKALTSGKVAKLLRSKTAHAVGRLGVALSTCSPQNAYQREALAFVLKWTAASFVSKRPVVWTTAFLPSELSYSLNAIPFMPELAAGVAAVAGISPVALTAAQSQGYSSDLCSFHRCLVGLLGMELLPRPDAVITTNLMCDGGYRVLENLAAEIGVPHYHIDLPLGTTISAAEEDYVAGQLRETWERLKAQLYPSTLQTDKRFWELSLKRAMQESAAATSYRLRINNLRKQKPGPWRGAEALSYVAMDLLAMGCQEGTAYFKALESSLAARVASATPAIPDETYRLIWLHLRPYTDAQLLNHIELNWKALIAFNDYSYVHWAPPEPDKPWHSLASRMLRHPSWGPAERRVALVLKLIKEYDADGVIQFDHWGCRQSTGMGSLLRQALRKNGIPFLELDGDCVDPRSASAGQHRSRVDAFMEVLEDAKTARRN